MPPPYRTKAILDALPADDPPAGPVLRALPADDPPLVLEPVLLALPGERELVFDAVLLEAPAAPAPRRKRLTLRGVAWAVVAAPEWLFGAAVLTAGLAALAALPVLQFFSLGYLLEAGARVARSGRLRDGFIGVRKAARLGAVLVACWLLLLPVRFVSQLSYEAQVVAPDTPTARVWRVALLVLIAATAGFFGLCALAATWLHRQFRRGGPRGGFYAGARDAAWDVVASLRLPYYFWLGFRGFVAALAWLVVPVSLLALGSLPGPGPFFGWVGALLLLVVLLYLPFLQMRMAAANRLSAAFALRAVRGEYRRAPWAFTLAFLFTLLSAVPLYLLKIEFVPRDAAWLPGLVFVAFIFPARLLAGWALGQARRRTRPAHWFFRWTGRLPLLPAAAFYVLIVYFSQFTSWDGVASLYQQHAFLLPAPFLGL
jgi:hypothetical protein